jgi:hypothetical protein
MMKSRANSDEILSIDTATSLGLLLNDQWAEYLQSCAENVPGNEKHGVEMKLYAAVRRLSEAIHEGIVAEALIEIGSNLMACEQMAILLTGRQKKKDPLLQSVGLTEQVQERLRSNSTDVVKAIPQGEPYVRGETRTAHPLLISLGITAAVPLWQNKKLKGAIVFFDFLPQRNGLDAGDRALLKLLTVYAGPCLFNC